MSSSHTDSNDADALKSILEQLGKSKAWQDLQQTVSSAAPAAPAAPRAAMPVTAPAMPNSSATLPAASAAPSAHISALLSRLQPRTAPPASVSTPPPTTPAISASHPPASDPPRSQASTVDLRHMTFNQALPRLASLGEDERAVAGLERIRKEQHEFEHKLRDDRAALLQSLRSKVDDENKILRLTGSQPLSVESMNRKFEKELRAFDTRALQQWDGLVAKQQAELEGLKVPTMFPTTLPSDRERQQRIVQVLEGILTGDE